MSREKLRKHSSITRAKGSPPHMRGKGECANWLLSLVRITPAHAGKSFSAFNDPDLSEDHPRTCGEKQTPSRFPDADGGSPPHMRGKGKSGSRYPARRRITPAHAGKRCDAADNHADGGDHPRTCGEKTWRWLVCRFRRGSPPHMRGKEMANNIEKVDLRITPAHAGKSGQVQNRLSLRRDHPRTCGEKPARYGHSTANLGSPPHMRGKVDTKVCGKKIKRITPAHAGKSLAVRVNDVGAGDHPRTCGEKLYITRYRALHWGSPPHMRGKVAAMPFCANLCRITPAHAGKRLPT